MIFLVRFLGFSPRTMKRDECGLTWSARATGVARRVASRIDPHRQTLCFFLSDTFFFRLYGLYFRLGTRFSPTPSSTWTAISRSTNVRFCLVSLYTNAVAVAFSSGKVASPLVAKSTRRGESAKLSCTTCARRRGRSREIRHEHKSVIVKKSLFAVFAHPLSVRRRNE